MVPEKFDVCTARVLGKLALKDLGRFVGMEGDGDEEMGEGEQGEQGRKPREKGKWYSEAIEYWSNVDATVDGVLGGYGRVSTMEIAESKQFLQQVEEYCTTIR